MASGLGFAGESSVLSAVCASEVVTMDFVIVGRMHTSAVSV